MDEPIVESLTRRVDRLERENRRWRRAGSLTCLGIAALLLMGQAQSRERVVEAQQFLVRDSTGEVRAALGLSDGDPKLILFDKDGTSRAALSLVPSGSPFLTLADRDGRPRAALTVLPDGSPILTFSDATITERIEIRLRDEGVPDLRLYEKDGKTLSGRLTTVSGSPSLALFRSGKARVLLTITADGSPGLRLTDPDGNARALLAAKADGVPGLWLSDKDGKVVWTVP